MAEREVLIVFGINIYKEGREMGMCVVGMGGVRGSILAVFYHEEVGAKYMGPRWCYMSHLLFSAKLPQYHFSLINSLLF